MYVWDLPDNSTTIIKANDTISYNWILANYHSSCVALACSVAL